MMVAAMDAMHERHKIRRTVGKTQPERTFVKADRLGHVTGEDQDV
jgi:hypothetical protein